jgi:hypothetical protein
MRLSLSAVRGNLRFIEQGIALLDQLSAADYATPARLGWAPVGSQFRHILDHYRCFLLGQREGRINYDARLRDRRIETDPLEAAQVARVIAEALGDIHVEDGDRPVMVQMDCGGNDGVPDWRPSTLGRELQFLVSHTVHHFALIKLLLEDRGIDAGEEFGTAPSTLAYQASDGGAVIASPAPAGNLPSGPGVPRTSGSLNRRLSPETSR